MPFFTEYFNKYCFGSKIQPLESKILKKLDEFSFDKVKNSRSLTYSELTPRTIEKSRREFIFYHLVARCTIHKVIEDENYFRDIEHRYEFLFKSDERSLYTCFELRREEDILGLKLLQVTPVNYEGENYPQSVKLYDAFSYVSISQLLSELRYHYQNSTNAFIRISESLLIKTDVIKKDQVLLEKGAKNIRNRMCLLLEMDTGSDITFLDDLPNLSKGHLLSLFSQLCLAFAAAEDALAFQVGALTMKNLFLLKIPQEYEMFLVRFKLCPVRSFGYKLVIWNPWNSSVELDHMIYGPRSYISQGFNWQVNRIFLMNVGKELRAKTPACAGDTKWLEKVKDYELLSDYYKNVLEPMLSEIPPPPALGNLIVQV